MLSTEPRPPTRIRIPSPGPPGEEPTVTNRRRVINGVIISATILAGAVAWQIIDGQSNQPATAEITNGGASIGSAPVQPAEGRP